MRYWLKKTSLRGVFALCLLGCASHTGKGAQSATGSTDNNEEKVKELEQALASDTMPADKKLNTLYELGQAYFALKRFSEAADTFAKWAKQVEQVEPGQDFVVAIAYAQAHRFAEAVPYAKKAVEGSEQPDEAWLKLLASLHYELKQDAEVAPVQERLAQAFPTRDNFLQLAATYQALKQHDKAVASLEKASTQGLLTEDKDFVTLARLYLQAGAPLKGASLLEKKIKEGKISKTSENLELLATCWLMGKDVTHAEAAFKQAGDGIGSGELYVELGRLEIERGEWVKARDALASAVQKGGLKSPGEARLLLGVAHYNTKRKDAALASLGEAKKYADTAKCADEWIKLVKSGRPGTAGGCVVGDPTGARD
jgi:tetratricopeptide (TPR) repeat protein